MFSLNAIATSPQPELQTPGENADWLKGEARQINPKPSGLHAARSGIGERSAFQRAVSLRTQDFHASCKSSSQV
jgi:hypothetical protein